ncbi:hypothetical protein BCR33DRAFT_724919 [Rhizoclosmatium globosum]|uniref:C2H2-type domain-containing protein n=1 Tax=Rhizoclosmatium globosum TaxID=329046 RepID=A0A1Y2B3R6_9FUNG|nr:hypothetical protein BCR33DRAFT_724919 [Rhizoclosmatium globosum]|eukprot:ORY28725.1 hypothetical protein BCR33DRAFT_724919 [Rhizoclosmatium globosum]
MQNCVQCFHQHETAAIEKRMLQAENEALKNRILLLERGVLQIEASFNELLAKAAGQSDATSTTTPTPATAAAPTTSLTYFQPPPTSFAFPYPHPHPHSHPLEPQPSSLAPPPPPPPPPPKQLKPPKKPPKSKQTEPVTFPCLHGCRASFKAKQLQLNHEDENHCPNVRVRFAREIAETNVIREPGEYGVLRCPRCRVFECIPSPSFVAHAAECLGVPPSPLTRVAENGNGVKQGGNGASSSGSGSGSGIGSGKARRESMDTIGIDIKKLDKKPSESDKTSKAILLASKGKPDNLKKESTSSSKVNTVPTSAKKTTTAKTALVEIPITSATKKQFLSPVKRPDDGLEKTVPCDEPSCPFMFKNKNQMQTHRWTFHGSECRVVFMNQIEDVFIRRGDDGILRCPQCNQFETINGYSLRDHAKKCDGSSFSKPSIETKLAPIEISEEDDEETIDDGESTVDDPSEELNPPRQQCRDCTSVFGTNEALWTHRNIIHNPSATVTFASDTTPTTIDRNTKTGNLECPKCGYTDRNSTTFIQHASHCKPPQTTTAASYTRSKSPSKQPPPLPHPLPKGAIPTFFPDGSRNTEGYATWVDLIHTYFPSTHVPELIFDGKLKVNDFRKWNRVPLVQMAPVWDGSGMVQVSCLPAELHAKFVEKMRVKREEEDDDEEKEEEEGDVGV